MAQTKCNRFGCKISNHYKCWQIPLQAIFICIDSEILVICITGSIYLFYFCAIYLVHDSRVCAITSKYSSQHLSTWTQLQNTCIILGFGLLVWKRKDCDLQ